MNELYIKKNTFTYNNNRYERLFNCEHKYRIILSDDDYDYVEDDKLIRELDNSYMKHN